MNDVQAVVKGNRAVARDTFLMDLDCALEPSLPGQFLMVKVSSARELFLRRPLAILGQGEGTLEILYKLKGEGTLELSRKKPGDVLWVLGPLGNCFSPPQNGESALFVAGGTGLPPVLALASRIGSGALVIGARSKGDIPLLDRMNSLKGVAVYPVTEDGSLGRRGMATDVLGELLAGAAGPCAVYACGPRGMLEKACELSGVAAARCEVSLEEYMACGFGVCSACTVKTSAGPRRVCSNGPVFDAATIAWGAR